MSKVTESMKESIIVPVVVIEDAKDAVPTAKALLDGGINVMEITLRTAAALDSIRNVAAQCPDMTVGVGTVLNLEQAKQAVEAGAKFIVAPGFDEETVKWCLEKGIDVTPGCVTPTEIMAARKLGLRVVKFFPANVYGYAVYSHRRREYRKHSGICRESGYLCSGRKLGLQKGRYLCGKLRQDYGAVQGSAQGCRQVGAQGGQVNMQGGQISDRKRTSRKGMSFFYTRISSAAFYGAQAASANLPAVS